MKMAFLYLPGRIARIDSAFQNQSLDPLPPDMVYRPSEFFYGAFELRDKGHEVSLFEAVEKPRRSVPKFIAEHLVRKKYLPIKTYVGIIDALWLLLPKLLHFDIVVATTPGIAFALCIWKTLGFFSRPIVAIQCGILNYPLNPLRIELTRYLMRQMSSQLFGVGELEQICRAYRIGRERMEVNCFGVDTHFWSSNGKSVSNGSILAIGNDSMRDFTTLLQAAKQIENRVTIVTKRPMEVEVPPNVQVIRSAWNSQELEDNAILDLFRGAMAVAVPLRESFQPSGQSVTLQGMACGKPVILTRTSGIWEKNHMRHRRNVLLVEPEKPEEWVKKIRLLNEDKPLRENIGNSAREYVCSYGSIGQFARRLERLCQMEMKRHGVSGH